MPSLMVDPSMFSLALYFLTSWVFMSLFLFICQTAGRMRAPLGTLLLCTTVQLPFSLWSFISLTIALTNSALSGCSITWCMYMVSGLAVALYAYKGSPLSSYAVVGHMA